MLSARIRAMLSIMMVCLLVLAPLSPVFAQSGGTCSTFRSWNTGDS